MAEYVEWTVNMIVTTEHEFVVPARTAEEAASIAESLYDEGEEGRVLSTSVESIDAATGAAEDDELLEEIAYAVEGRDILGT